jgi:hypothetical protein
MPIWLRTLPQKSLVCLVLAFLPFCGASATWAQTGTEHTAEPARPPRDLVLSGKLPDQPSQPPAFSIPVEPLGFVAPGAIYLGQRATTVSLDFLDENHILFTFRVPGLLRREAGASPDSDEHQIRAVVVALPAGTVSAEALWTLHDRVRYLWMLKDGHFLLRDGNDLQEGDATLVLKPRLQFPGPLFWLEIDPTQQFLVTDSREPAATQAKPGQVGVPATASASMTVDGQDPPVPPSQPDLVVRILHFKSGQVLLVSRVRSTVHLPINSQGYLEGLRGRGLEWVLNLNYFTGGSLTLGHFDSTCAPTFDFVSEQVILATGCDASGTRTIEAMTTAGKRLWQDLTSPQSIWPVLVMAPNGSRIASETLAVSHAVNAYAPIYSDDVKGQLVRILDAATGKVALEAPASPVLDAGGNVAISPSGRRVAVLNAGALQVFDLPAPPPVSETAPKPHTP